MNNLSKLSIVPLKRTAAQSPQEHRRSKLVAKLEEQLALAQAQAEGKKYVVVKPSWSRDENGNKQRVQREKIVRPWWWQDGEGLGMVVRYGARAIELSKGKRAITIAHVPMLPGAINTIIAAVNAGELDGAIEAAINEAKHKGARA
jgi:hypothetical protein